MMLKVNLRGLPAEVAEPGIVHPHDPEPATPVEADLMAFADPVPSDAPLQAAIDIFRRFPEARFLAVVDGAARPLGAIHERLVRDLLFSPFGHALLANPGCRWTLQELVNPCSAIDLAAPTDRMIAAYGARADAEGLILTKNGRYHALLPGAALLRLAADRERREQQRQRAGAEAAIRRSRALEQAFARFRADAVTFGETLAAAAAGIEDSARYVAERAGLNGQQALTVAAAAHQSSDAIAEVASSSADLARQGRQIEERVVQALAAFDRAVLHVEQGAGKARSLSASADQIGSIVGLIAAVAGKVNMLAINATIEAARAGPAGRSFAVVAGEVKTLAAQVAKAVRDIEAQIGTVRIAIADNAASNQAVEAIVRGLADICADISASVASQASATRLIAESVDQAARGSASVSSNIEQIGERAKAGGAMAVKLGGVAEQLGGQAEAMRDRVDRFLDELQAA